MTVSKVVGGYIHKLRLEALDGAYLSAASELPPLERKHATAWILVKFISWSIAFSSLLIFAAREIR